MKSSALYIGLGVAAVAGLFLLARKGPPDVVPGPPGPPPPQPLPGGPGAAARMGDTVYIPASALDSISLSNVAVKAASLLPPMPAGATITELGVRVSTEAPAALYGSVVDVNWTQPNGVGGATIPPTPIPWFPRSYVTKVYHPS